VIGMNEIGIADKIFESEPKGRKLCVSRLRYLENVEKDLTRDESEEMKSRRE
jgi:hypothetical protein